MPCCGCRRRCHIADLNPLEITGGLAFDPQTKSAIRRDARKPEEKAATIAKEQERYKKAKTKWDPKAYSRLHESKGGPIMRVTGSATYAIKPEYKYFSFWSALYPQSKIFIDGKPVRPDRNVVTIPTGAKTLKIEARDPHLRQAGFITRSPRVTHSAISLPGHDPTRLVPVVHRASGQRVGCRTVWAEAGELMSIMFDSSSGDHEYWVYLVDQRRNRRDWIGHHRRILFKKFVSSIATIPISKHSPALRSYGNLQQPSEGAFRRTG